MAHAPESQPDCWLYSAAQCRQLDRLAGALPGISEALLMERAGAAAFALLRQRWPQAFRILVLCGTGNNGGDGFVVARLAHETGLAVKVLQLGDADRIDGAARAALEPLLATGIEPQPFVPGQALEADVLVDALLGTGLERPVEGDWRAAIAAMNASGIPCLALDLPSGLHADRGTVLGAAVRADVTLTFIGRKPGLYTGRAADHVGEVQFAGLEVPAAVYEQVTAAARLLTAPPLGPLARPRRRASHKGEHGHVLIIGGAPGMPGAVRLAGEAALRAGAGLVSVATHPDHAAWLPMTRPELMCHGVSGPRDLAPLLARADVLAIGPGLGQDAWGQALLAAALETGLPLVVDADALNLLAREPLQRGNWILTPHPGEAARLLGTTAADVEADRYAAVRTLAERYGGTVVLKGAGTLVVTGNAPATVCERGNPGMASGGMGDVLTGLVAALRAQGLGETAAAEAGVWLHGVAGDAGSREGERGLLAGDLPALLRAELNLT
jgi:NAD(P)H-hydrate epimerase